MLLAALLLLAQDSPIFHSDVKLTTVLCQLGDFRGVPVKDLRREDLRLFENGEPREIAGLTRQEDLPLTLGIVIDISPSQDGLIENHEAAARHFIEGKIRQGDRAFVVTAAADVILRSEFTGGPRGLRQSLASSVGQPLGVACGRFAGGRPICGGTALWNAVYASAQYIARFSGNKAVLILSDGNDTGSTHTPEAVIEAARLANARVYAIQYPDGVTGFSEAEPLRRVTELTGGLMLRAQTSETSAMLEAIESDLRSRYTIEFYAHAALHAVRLESTVPGVTVRILQIP